MSGMTGELYLDDAGRIHRQLTWAKMERGKPRTLPGQAGNLVQDSGFTIY